MVAELRTRLPRAFESPDYQERVEAALESVHRRHKELTEEMVAEARRHGVGLALTEAGITVTPLGPNGEPMTPEEIAQLPGEEAERLQRGQQAVQEFVTGRVAVLRQLEREAAQARLQVNRDVGNFVMQPLFAELHEKYATVEPEAGVHLDDLKEDMLRNLPLFLQHEQDGQAGPRDPFAGAAGGDDDLGRYRVNVFTDRSRASGAPVIFEATPTYNNVFGRVQHRLRQGVMSADFMMARPGAIHRANGGFLVLQAKDVLAYPFVWQALKEALRSRQAAIENLAEQFSSVPAFTIEPEPIPLDVKVVLIGNPQLARMLMLHDEDFPKLFKVKADFAYEVELKPENITKHAQFVAAQVQEHDLPALRRRGRGAAHRAVVPPRRRPREAHCPLRRCRRPRDGGVVLGAGCRPQPRRRRRHPRRRERAQAAVEPRRGPVPGALRRWDSPHRRNRVGRGPDQRSRGHRHGRLLVRPAIASDGAGKPGPGRVRQCRAGEPDERPHPLEGVPDPDRLPDGQVWRRRDAPGPCQHRVRADLRGCRRRQRLEHRALRPAVEPVGASQSIRGWPSPARWTSRAGSKRLAGPRGRSRASSRCARLAG